MDTYKVYFVDDESVQVEADTVQWPKSTEPIYVFYRGSKAVLVVPMEMVKYVEKVEPKSD